MMKTFDIFVIPFVVGMVFVLIFCLAALGRVILQMPHSDRRRFLVSLVTPKIFLRNIRDIFCDCLLHVKIWRRKPILGFMHSAIAFGWFMIIVIGHIEVFVLQPFNDCNLSFAQDLGSKLYLPIFFRFFSPEAASSTAKILAFLMDFFLALILCGILTAFLKKMKSTIVGVKRITKFGLADSVIRIALWTIFPFRLAAETTQLMAFWWLYSLDLCLFMFLLPFTRYMHIPSEMLLILLRNAGIKSKSPRKGFALAEMYSCPGCGLCIDACPMSIDDEKSGMTSVYFIRNLRKNDPDKMREMAEVCLMCGKCVSVCPVAIQSCDLKLNLRKNEAENLISDLSYLNKVDISENICEKGEKILFFAGCMTHLTPRIIKSMKEIFEKAGERYEIMDSEGGICCGKPMLLAGKTDAAQAVIAKNTEMIKKSGAKKLVVSCPICYRVFKEEYQLEDIEIQHHSQYIDEIISKGKLKLSRTKSRIVYHDPCELGRPFGIYDEPRRVVESCGVLIEAEQNRNMSVCCGGSLGSITMSKDKRDAVTASSLANLMANHPDEIATACPLCLKTFAKKTDIQVNDIAELVAENCS